MEPGAVGPAEAGPAAAPEAGAGCCPASPGSCACGSGTPRPPDGGPPGPDPPAAGAPAIWPPGSDPPGTADAVPVGGTASETPATVPSPVVPEPEARPEPAPGRLAGGAGRGSGAAAGEGPASYTFWEGAQEASHRGSVRQNAATAVVSGLTPQLDFMTAPHSLPRHAPYLNVTAGRRAGERCPGVSLAAAQSRIGCSCRGCPAPCPETPHAPGLQCSGRPGRAEGKALLRRLRRQARRRQGHRRGP